MATRTGRFMEFSGGNEIQPSILGPLLALRARGVVRTVGGPIRQMMGAKRRRGEERREILRGSDSGRFPEKNVAETHHVAKARRSGARAALRMQHRIFTPRAAGPGGSLRSAEGGASLQRMSAKTQRREEKSEEGLTPPVKTRCGDIHQTTFRALDTVALFLTRFLIFSS